ncbi:MAG: hypothetical protein ABFD96_03625 [Armatimonadia bacterium]
MAARIGLLLLGHPDYPNDLGQHFARLCTAALNERNVEVIPTEPATDAPAAAEAAKELLKHDPEGIVVLPGTWLEGATALAAIREVEHLPLALWGLPMFDWESKRESTGSFVAVCSLKAPLERMDYRFKTVVGLPDDPATVNELASFAHAAHATARLKRLRAGLIGYSAMSIYPGTFDHVLLRKQIGPEVVHLDTYTLVREAERAYEAEVQALAERVGGQAEVQATPERLRKACGLAAALKSLVAKHHLQALNVKCQYELSQEYGMTACLPMALLADEGVVASCEGDMMVTVTQALLHYLTAQTVTYGDILDLQDNRLLLSACGFAPFGLAHEGDTRRVCEFDYPGFDGLICSFTLKRGPVTFARLAEGKGDYYLVYGTGSGVDTDLRQGKFPALQIEMDGSPARLMEIIPSQHFALCYGDVSQQLEDVCRILGLRALRV